MLRNRPPAPLRSPLWLEPEHREAANAERGSLARAAVRLVPPEGTIAVGGGTAMTAVARELARRDRLVVITTALDVALELAGAPGIELVVTPGEAIPGTTQLAGADTARSLVRIDLDLALVQPDVVTGDGLFVRDPRTAATVGALVARARSVVVLAERAAVGPGAGTRIVPPEGRCSLVIPEPFAGPIEGAAGLRGVSVLRVS